MNISELFLQAFIIKAIIAGVGIAALCGPIGSIIVWRRMSYFGDSLAHSSLLGIALGLVAGVNLNISIIFVCILFAVLISWLQQKRILAIDTLLGILSHAALSIGMVVFSFIQGAKINTYNFLFGDILTVSNTDIFWIFIVLVLGFSWLYFTWNNLVLATISEDLAKAEGINTKLLNIVFMLLIALLIAISTRVLGVLLITSLTIIPAAAARLSSKSPKQMAGLASVIGVLSVIFGILFSYNFDAPSGPAIIVTATCIFACVMLFSGLKNLSKNVKIS
jgi:zinc transport system permease protein